VEEDHAEIARIRSNAEPIVDRFNSYIANKEATKHVNMLLTGRV